MTYKKFRPFAGFLILRNQYRMTCIYMPFCYNKIALIEALLALFCNKNDRNKRQQNIRSDSRF